MTYWVSIMAHKFEGDRMEHLHALCPVKATNSDEAYGMGVRLALRLIPSSDGWKRHHVITAAPDMPTISPDDRNLTLKIQD